LFQNVVEEFPEPNLHAREHNVHLLALIIAIRHFQERDL